MNHSKLPWIGVESGVLGSDKPEYMILSGSETVCVVKKAEDLDYIKMAGNKFEEMKDMLEELYDNFDEPLPASRTAVILSKAEALLKELEK